MWSPQLYVSNGRLKGFEESLLENACEQIDNVKNKNPLMPGILSLRHLSKRTQVDYTFLRDIVSRSCLEPYKNFSIKKRSGGRRYIHVPAPPLMRVQKWIHEYILTNVSVHRSSYAFNRHCSIVDCAARHCGARWLIKMDIKGFFESISEIQVYDVFRGLGYQPLVAFELARLCTYVVVGLYAPRKYDPVWKIRAYNKKIAYYDAEVLGYLPQGAPTSPIMSNLVMRDVDEKLVGLATKYKLNYTRYSDDLVFSTRLIRFDRKKANDFICEVDRLLRSRGFRPQHRKTSVVPPGSRKIVLGLQVDGELPRLRREFKDSLRQHLYYIEKYGPYEHLNKRGFESVWGMKRHIRGMIDYSKMVEPIYAKNMLAIYNAIDWPL